jgi:hypothetical protein
MRQAFEGLTVSFRFILPIMFGVFMYCYTADQSRLHTEMTDLKETSKAIWMSIDANAKKVACMNQDIAKCCPNSVNCY